MNTQKKEMEDLIAKTIRQVGHEKDMQDILQICYNAKLIHMYAVHVT